MFFFSKPFPSYTASLHEFVFPGILTCTRMFFYTCLLWGWLRLPSHFWSPADLLSSHLPSMHPWASLPFPDFPRGQIPLALPFLPLLSSFLSAPFYTNRKNFKVALEGYYHLHLCNEEYDLRYSKQIISRTIQFHSNTTQAHT